MSLLGKMHLLVTVRSSFTKILPTAVISDPGTEKTLSCRGPPHWVRTGDPRTRGGSLRWPPPSVAGRSLGSWGAGGGCGGRRAGVTSAACVFRVATGGPSRAPSFYLLPAAGLPVRGLLLPRWLRSMSIPTGLGGQASLGLIEGQFPSVPRCSPLFPAVPHCSLLFPAIPG